MPPVNWFKFFSPHKINCFAEYILALFSPGPLKRPGSRWRRWGQVRSGGQWTGCQPAVAAGQPTSQLAGPAGSGPAYTLLVHSRIGLLFANRNRVSHVCSFTVFTKQNSWFPTFYPLNPHTFPSKLWGKGNNIFAFYASKNYGISH